MKTESNEHIQIVPCHKIQELLRLLGKHYVKEEVYLEDITIKDSYKNPAYLQRFNPSEYIKKASPFVVSFLTGVTGMDFSQENEKVKFAVSSCCEQISYIRNLNLVLPCSFLTNLIQSCTSGSKTVSVLNGKVTPAGSYTTVN